MLKDVVEEFEISSEAVVDALNHLTQHLSQGLKEDVNDDLFQLICEAEPDPYSLACLKDLIFIVRSDAENRRL